MEPNPLENLDDHYRSILQEAIPFNEAAWQSITNVLYSNPASVSEPTSNPPSIGEFGPTTSDPSLSDSPLPNGPLFNPSEGQNAFSSISLNDPGFLASLSSNGMNDNGSSGQLGGSDETTSNPTEAPHEQGLTNDATPIPVEEMAAGALKPTENPPASTLNSSSEPDQDAKCFLCRQTWARLCRSDPETVDYTSVEFHLYYQKHHEVHLRLHPTIEYGVSKTDEEEEDAVDNYEHNSEADDLEGHDSEEEEDQSNEDCLDAADDEVALGPDFFQSNPMEFVDYAEQRATTELSTEGNGTIEQSIRQAVSAAAVRQHTEGDETSAQGTSYAEAIEAALVREKQVFNGREVPKTTGRDKLYLAVAETALQCTENFAGNITKFESLDHARQELANKVTRPPPDATIPTNAAQERAYVNALLKFILDLGFSIDNEGALNRFKKIYLPHKEEIELWCWGVVDIVKQRAINGHPTRKPGCSSNFKERMAAIMECLHYRKTTYSSCQTNNTFDNLIADPKQTLQSGKTNKKGNAKKKVQITMGKEVEATQRQASNTTTPDTTLDAQNKRQSKKKTTAQQHRSSTEAPRGQNNARAEEQGSAQPQNANTAHHPSPVPENQNVHGVADVSRDMQAVQPLIPSPLVAGQHGVLNHGGHPNLAAGWPLQYQEPYFPASPGVSEVPGVSRDMRAVRPDGTLHPVNGQHGLTDYGGRQNLAASSALQSQPQYHPRYATTIDDNGSEQQAQNRPVEQYSNTYHEPLFDLMSSVDIDMITRWDTAAFEDENMPHLSQTISIPPHVNASGSHPATHYNENILPQQLNGISTAPGAGQTFNSHQHPGTRRAPNNSQVRRAGQASQNSTNTRTLRKRSHTDEDALVSTSPQGPKRQRISRFVPNHNDCQSSEP
ncbi:uncharacterized protein DSM5745_05865 [Aspergillus mulundensis]|uniref:Uncharacterized protein n=1 Tax=Aspergillus mulundensis TaxID=1810919 RepID=A0A3D8RY73_9EURO|nr:hypothetical protein DSM5745_05865 [Aspergillus mulundensis]RDW79013.1 hypothetical protein DSM5745_05865 [Aspergillus mulundensis]